MKQVDFLKIFLLLAVGCLCHSDLMGQSISGCIKEEDGPLLGASVGLSNTTIGIMSDEKGIFVLNNVPLGTYKLTVTYLGYEPFDTTLVVNNGRIDLGTMVLQPSSQHSLDNVVVVGSMGKGELKAINAKKTAVRMMDVLAADGIGKLPDRNAGEAVQRIPGVSLERDQGEGRFVSVRGLPAEWSSATINGDRIPTAEEQTTSRSTAFDFFPSELIQFVEVSKAITPDMEGDAMGGNVNFITKTAPDSKTLNLSLASGYNFKAGKPLYSGNILWGNTSKNKKFGYLLNASVWNREWATDNYEVQYAGSPDKGITRLELRDYYGRRRTLGFNGGLTYNPTKDLHLYMRGLYGTLDDNEKHYKTRFEYTKGRVNSQNIYNELITQMYGGELGGSLKVSANSTLDVKLSHYSNEFRYGNIPDKAYPSYQVIQFNQKVDYTGLTPDKTVLLDVDGGTDDYEHIGTHLAPGTQLDPSKFTYAYTELYQIGIREKDNIVAQANLSTQVRPNFELKIGAKFRDKERTSFERDLYYYWDESKAPLPTMTEFNLIDHPKADQYLQELGSPYKGLFPKVLSLDAMKQFVGQNSQHFLPLDQSGTVQNGEFLGSNFTVREKHMAGYVMGTWTISPRALLTGGLRYENTQQTSDGYDYNESTKVLTANEKSQNYGVLLPMLHFKYTPDEHLNIRAAVTKTFSRPSFGFLVAGGSYSELDKTYTYGNPSVKPTQSWNFDGSIEYYPGGLALFSAGVFYKDIINPIFQDSRFYAEFNGHQDVTVTQPLNGDNAKLYGAEFIANKKFTFLPGILKGFGLNANYTIMRSQMSIPGRTDEVRIPRQANDLLNIALYYEYGGFSARVALNYKGAFITEHGQDKDNDVYYDQYTTVDVNVNYKLNKRFTFFAEAQNLLNKPLRYYLGDYRRPVQVEYYGIRGQVGLKMNVF